MEIRVVTQVITEIDLSPCSEKKEEEKDDPQPIVHEEPQREFIPIHKRDADHKPGSKMNNSFPNIK